jgi:hypothetical protein
MTDAERLVLIQKGTAAAYQQLEQLDASALGELERLYRAVVANVSQALAQYGSDGYFAQQHLKPFLALLEQFLADTAVARANLLDQGLAAAAQAGAVPAVLMGATGVDAAIAASVAAVYKLELADGLQLSDRLWRIDQRVTAAIGQSLRQALAEGSHPLAAARALLRSGRGITPDLLKMISGLKVDNLQKMVGDKLLTGKGNALYNVQRVFQTEFKRAHAISYVKSNEGASGLIGYKFRLSPLHKRTDICDTLAAANSYGLGAGIYPADKILNVYPAHPNTRSRIVAVFGDLPDV